MGATHLKCRECATEYALEARFVCERCFGPLEVAYDHAGLGDDPAATRRRIQGGPQNIWRYADFLPLEAPPAPSQRVGRPRSARRLHAAAEGRPAGRASRARRGVGQERRPQPHALLQGPRRRRRRRPGARAGLRHARVRVDRQPRQRGRGRRRRAGDGLLRLHPERPRGAEDPRHRDLRHEPREDPRQLRRRQPSLHRAVRRARELGVRERQHAAVLRRGLQDPGVRDRRAARLPHARPHRRRRSPPARCSRRSARASRSGWTSASSKATFRS